MLATTGVFATVCVLVVLDSVDTAGVLVLLLLLLVLDRPVLVPVDVFVVPLDPVDTVGVLVPVDVSVGLGPVDITGVTGSAVVLFVQE